MAKKKTLRTDLGLPADYGALLASIKERVLSAQTRAILSVNREMIALYWDLGREIARRQQQEGWGRATVERLADDLQKAFPGIGGLSRTNLFRMRAFYLAYSGPSGVVPQPVGQLPGEEEDAECPPSEGESPILPQAVAEMGSLGAASGDPPGSIPPEAVAELPWGHNVLLLERVKETGERLWYAAKALEHGWSRAVLTAQVESGLYRRQGAAVTNFAARLPAPQSDLAQQTLKDPYVFDFLTLAEDAVERDLETGLVDHVQRFLLELGAGFAYVGRQVHVSVGEEDFYLDLLFYHLRLRCYVVIDLKMRKFTPEDAGKMNFYLSAVDTQMRHADDGPAIGLVLCKTRDRVVAEYALRDLAKPIGVAEWQAGLVQKLPDSLQGVLPSVEQIEAELTADVTTGAEPREGLGDGGDR
ncbi:MAG: PDDEXK nuclease domain-containing protein [Lacipirellulaceae bacterium]